MANFPMTQLKWIANLILFAPVEVTKLSVIMIITMFIITAIIILSVIPLRATPILQSTVEECAIFLT